jgi:ABC-2 type transport system permease protein/lipopolysaccharide transport system permease protein
VKTITAQPSKLSKALKDLREGILSIHIWPMMALQEIRQRYRRSMLGPLWLTITTAAMLAAMGPIYAKLLNQRAGNYFVYLAVSFVSWSLLASLINESCNAFIIAEGYIKDTKLPLSIHALRCVWRNLIVFAHNFLIIVLVVAWNRPGDATLYLLFPLGLFVMAINGLWLAILFGLLGARFRDIPQTVATVVQVAFFLTPVMWRIEMLGENRWIAEFNPLYHLLEVIRAPLLGTHPSALSWEIVILITVVGFLATLTLFSRFRGRIAYWV